MPGVLAVIVLAVSGATPQECPVVEPHVVERLRAACTEMMSAEVEAQFRAWADRALASTSNPIEADSGALASALKRAALTVDAADTVVLVDARRCRLPASVSEDETCLPTLTLLNTGLLGYDADDESRAALSGRGSAGRAIVHPRLTRGGTPPTAYIQLQCLAVSLAAGSPEP